MSAPEAIQDLGAELRGYRFAFHSEQELQDELLQFFVKESYTCDREVILTPQDRPDFVVKLDGIGTVAVEVKIKGAHTAILRQLKRYADHKSIDAVLLISSKAYHVPETLSGKPVFSINLWRL